MKKIIFGSASAVLSVVGFSAFKSAKTTLTTYYWFSIDADNVSVGERTLTYTNNSINSVAFANTISSTLDPSNAICSQDDIHQCIIGFTKSRIIEIDSTHIFKNHIKSYRRPLLFASEHCSDRFKIHHGLAYMSHVSATQNLPPGEF